MRLKDLRSAVTVPGAARQACVAALIFLSFGVNIVQTELQAADGDPVFLALE